MKNLLRYVMLLTVAVTLFSCNKEEIPASAEEYIKVNFAVEVPQGQATKSIGKGENAKNLDFAVYRAEAYTAPDGTVFPAGEYLSGMSGANNAVITKIADGKWEVVLTLVKNVKYDVVFWAYADNAPYTFNKAEAKITVNNYTSDANADVRDAFYKCYTDYVASDQPVDVDLTRPFAQINFGADDYNPFVTDLGISMTSKIDTKAHTGIASAKVPNTLHVLDGTVSGEEEIDFKLSMIPYETGKDNQLLVKLNNVEYSWVAMNYILAGEEKTLGNVRATFHYNNMDLTIDVNNVPYKRNYKTNILGSLFTESSKFEVVIVPNFDGTNPPIEI